MKLEKLQAQPPAAPDTKPRTAKVAVPGGHVTITYRPAPEGAEALPEVGLLRGHVSAWSVEDAEGSPVPVTSTAIRSLSPEVRGALVEAVLSGKSDAEEKAKK